MVGHLNVPGLQEEGVPATLSPSAYRYLRERAGASRLLMTDSLSMGAISVGMRPTPAQAAVRALSAGADVVLVHPGPGPGPVVDAVAAALGRGSYSRAAAVASVRRMLAVKRTTNAPLPMTSLAPAHGTTGASQTPTLSGIPRSRQQHAHGAVLRARHRLCLLECGERGAGGCDVGLAGVVPHP
jgi:beta-glucosidase-like glycosyl hydrolase